MWLLYLHHSTHASAPPQTHRHTDHHPCVTLSAFLYHTQLYGTIWRWMNGLSAFYLMHFITDMSRRPSPSNHCTITQSVISIGRNRTLLLGYSTTRGRIIIISFHAVPTRSKVNLCPAGIKFQLTYRRNSKANHTTEDRSKHYPEFLFMAIRLLRPVSRTWKDKYRWTHSKVKPGST